MIRPQKIRTANPRPRSNISGAAFGVLVAFIVLTVGGCRSGAIKPEQTVSGIAGHAEGQWRGKALLKNLKTNKSNSLSIDILAREPARLRMEITGPFGIHVASIALKDDEVRCLLTQQKRFITASADASAMAKVIPVRIAPSNLMSILFDRPFSPNEWDCSDYNFSKLPVECNHRREKLTVKWIEKNGLSRRLKIITPDSDVELVLDEAKSKVQMNDGAFDLSAPEGYRVESRDVISSR